MLQRDRLQPPVEMIGPAVIAALEFVGVALVGGDHHRAAMRALIVDDLQLPSASRTTMIGLRPIVRAEIVAGCLHLAFVADIDPGGAEDALDLERENRRIGVEAAMNARRAAPAS